MSFFRSRARGTVAPPTSREPRDRLAMVPLRGSPDAPAFSPLEEAFFAAGDAGEHVETEV